MSYSFISGFKLLDKSLEFNVKIFIVLHETYQLAKNVDIISSNFGILPLLILTTYFKKYIFNKFV